MIHSSGRRPLRRVLRLFPIALAAALLLAPAAAVAVDPNEAVSPGGTWFSGSLIQQPGTNCATAILGSAYAEIMVSGVASYGGAPSGGPVRVDSPYYTSILVAIPGNPCGSGTSAVATDVQLPPSTTVDISRPIRCFGQAIGATTFVELTGGQWSHLGSSGPYCPTQATPSIYVSGGVSVGFRPLASGQMFQMFLPVKSTQTLVGMGDNTHAFRWATTATGVYSNPGLSTAWANVFPAVNAGSSPYVYFAREPAAVPFWKADAPASPDVRNRAEFWANFYTAGLAGAVTYKIERTDFGGVVWQSSSDLAFNGTVAAGQDLVQILATGSAVGPNGGYVPVAFDPPGTPLNPAGEWNVPMRITWTFTPTGASPVSNSANFRTLAGPDTDGDGVADVTDACPAVKGTLANGCLPSAAVDDPDGDGVFGPADKCPAVAGKGALDGCPVIVALPPSLTPTSLTPTPPTALGSRLDLRSGAVLARARLAKGLPVRVTCTRDARATVSLRLAKRMAARLGLKAPAAGLVVATGAGSCRAGVAATLNLIFTKALRKRLAQRGPTVAATLTVALVGLDGTRSLSTLGVKLR